VFVLVPVRWIQGHTPELTLYDENGAELEVIDLSPFSFDALHELFKKKGFKLHSSKPQPTQVIDNAPIKNLISNSDNINIQPAPMPSTTDGMAPYFFFLLFSIVIIGWVLLRNSAALRGLFHSTKRSIFQQKSSGLP
jgi:hypothetical protein